MAIPFLKGIDVAGTADLSNLTIDGAQGTDGQVLTSTGSGVAWENPIIDGSGSDNKVAFWTDSNTLSFDPNLHWDSTNDRLGINKTDPNAKLHIVTGNSDVQHSFIISHTRNDSNVGTQAFKIDANFSGADTTTSDRTNAGLYIDLDSSADGDATHEVRSYGIWVDARITGFNDLLRGGYFFVESNNSTEKTAEITGVYGHVTHDSSSTNGGVSSMYGTRGVANIQDYGDVDNTYALHGLVQIANNRNANVDNAHGVYGEIQIDEADALTYANLYGFRSVIDNNEGSVPNFSNQYLFFGDYQGTRGSGAYGVYVDGERHYLENKLGIGVTDPSEALDVSGNANVSGTITTDSHGSSTNWKQAYDNHITGIGVSGTSTKTITLTQRDGGTITTTFTDLEGSGGGIDMTNGSNNRVVTAVDSDSINAESGLLFGGSYLEITPGNIATPLQVKRTSASTRQVNLLLSANDGSSTSEGFLGVDSSADLRYGASSNTSTNSLILTEDNLDFVVNSSTNSSIIRLAGGGTNFASFSVGGEGGAVTINTGSNSFTVGLQEFIEEKYIYTSNDSNAVYMPMVKGGMYATQASSVTGQILIKLPSYKTDMMQQFYVDIYDYSTGESMTFKISGYNYSDTNATWYNTSVVNLSDDTDRDFTVRFGADTSLPPFQYVAIGETNSTWSYPQINIRDFYGGYATSEGDTQGSFNISFVTTTPGSVSQTHTGNFVAGDYNNLKNTPTIPTVNNGTLTVQGTGALGGSGTFTANQSGNTTISISHDDTSSQGSVDNSNGTVIQDVTLDGYGHVTALGSVNLDGRYYTESESDSRFVNVTGDTMTGDLTADQFISTNNGNGTNYRIGDDAWIGDINIANTFRVQGNQDATKGYITFGSTSNTQLGRSGSGALTWGGNTIWHAGNDGSGTGLDADKLDGQQGSYYVNTSTSQTIGGNKTITGQTQFGGQVTFSDPVTFDSDLTLDGISSMTESTALVMNGGNEIGYRTLGSNAFNSTTIPTNYLRDNAFDSGIGLYLQGGSFNAGTDTVTAPLVIDEEDFIYTKDGGYLRKLIGKTNNQIQIGQSGTSLITSINFLPGTAGNSAVYINSNVIWNAGNDGAGSTLDADLLDGQHGSHYLNYNNLTNTPTIPSGSSLVRVYQNQNYVASSSSTSNRGNFGAGLTVYEGYNSGTNRPFTYDTTLQIMSTGSQGFEIAADWVSASSTPLKVRSLRDCCQGWSPWINIWTEHNFTGTSINNWNTAYGWGNHASAGYLTGSPTSITVGGILLEDSSDRSGLLEINQKGSSSWSGIQIVDGSNRWSYMGNNSNVGIYDDTNGEWILLYNVNAETELYYNGTMKMWTKSNGIGIAGGITSTGSWSYTNGSYGTQTIGYYYGAAYWYNSALSYYVGSLTGTSSSVNRLHVKGSIGVGSASASTTWGKIDASNDIVAYSSDKRLKENILPINGALDKISKLSGFTYNWNEKAKEEAEFNTEERLVGVFAQDVQEVLPEAVKLAPFDNDGDDVSKSGENYLTVQYEKIVPLLIEGMKEQQAQIEKLTTILEEVTKQLNNGNNI